MTTATAFREAILATPADMTARLVYADWCDENGLAGRAELLRQESVTLSMWVSNQPDGAGYDTTGHYLHAAGLPLFGDAIEVAAGVTYDPRDNTLTGDPVAVYAEFRRVAALVAAAGHGEVAEADMGEPALTACPTDWRAERWTSARETLARHASTDAGTWLDYIAEVAR